MNTLKSGEWYALPEEVENPRQHRLLEDIAYHGARTVRLGRHLERNIEDASKESGQFDVKINFQLVSRLLDEMNALVEQYHELVGNLVMDDEELREKHLDDYQAAEDRIHFGLKDVQTGQGGRAIAITSLIRDINKIRRTLYQILRHAKHIKKDRGTSFEEAVHSAVKLKGGVLNTSEDTAPRTAAPTPTPEIRREPPVEEPGTADDESEQPEEEHPGQEEYEAWMEESQNIIPSNEGEPM